MLPSIYSWTNVEQDDKEVSLNVITCSNWNDNISLQHEILYQRLGTFGDCLAFRYPSHSQIRLAVAPPSKIAIYFYTTLHYLFHVLAVY